MNNDEKIKEIRDLLEQPNCAGVSLTLGNKATPKPMNKIKFARWCLTQHPEILDYRPIPIELEQLDAGDKVWADGEIGIIWSKPMDPFKWYVTTNKRTKSFDRHELLKVNV